MATLPTAKELAHSFTIKVRIKHMGEWHWRLKIGAWLIRLAAWVMWMNVEIESD